MNKLRTLILTLFLSLSVGILGSCSVWDLVKPASPGLSVDTEVVAGDKNQAVNTAVGETNNTAETISITNIDESPSFWWTLFGLAGWFLPTPLTMWNGIKRKFM